MLAIRLQRTGRKGHAMFRVVVQDSRRTPTSGKIVAQLGTYDPHTKAVQLDAEKATFYVTHGAQPSPRAGMLMKAQGVSLPEWVKTANQKSGTIRHADKLRRNQPKEVAVVPEVVVTEAVPEAVPVEAETSAEEAKA